jgi:transposase
MNVFSPLPSGANTHDVRLLEATLDQLVMEMPGPSGAVQSLGVHYRPGHVWKILAALEWSLQRPAKRARERNDEGRRLWMAKRWPAIEKRPAARSLDSLP